MFTRTRNWFTASYTQTELNPSIHRLTVAALFFLFLLLSTSVSAQTQSTFPPHGTGVDTKAGTGSDGPVTLDTNFFIVAGLFEEDPSLFPFPTGAFVVTKLANGWGAALSGTKWVGPSQEQGNDTQTGACCMGATTYRTTFNVSDPSSTSLTVSLLADDNVTVFLNSTQVFVGPSVGYASPATFTLSGSQFKSGANTMDFLVNNGGGGPSGLDVSFSSAPAGAPGSNTAPGTYSLQALPDPVDSATGQFYEAETDLALGGPLSLSFSRYYSSALSGTGRKSAVGANWMTNFDLNVAAAGNSATVSLFGGKVLKFSKSGSAWSLDSPKDIAFQLVQSAAGFQLLNPLRQLVFTFDSTGAFTRVEDRNGNALTITPGANGPTSVTDGLGRTLTLTYTSGQLSSVRDQTGRSVSFTYSGGTLASATDVLNNITRYTYTATGALMTKKQLPAGNTPTTQAYDSSNRVISQTDAGNNVSKIAYDGKGGTTVTDAAGKNTKQGNDANGNLAQLTDANGGVANVTYDGSGRRTSVTNKMGGKSTYTYHAPTGALASATNSSGKTTSYTYSPTTQGAFTFYDLTGATNQDGSSSSMTYDAHGNLTSVTKPDGSTNSFTYDNNGRLTMLTDANNQSSSYAYNPDGTLASLTDPAGNVTSYSYDSLKRLAGKTAPNGGVTQFTYDAAGRVIGTQDATGATTSTTFDANGQRSTWTSPSGGTYTFAHTANLDLASTTDPLGNKTQYTYNANRRLASVTNAAGEKAAYTYDSANHVISIADNTGTRFTYTYDAEGRVATVTDAIGRKTSYAYDSLGHPTSITTPGGNKYTMTYDDRGRLIGKTNPLGETQSLVRDAAGRATQINMPGSLSTTIQRDSVGRVTAVTSPNGNTWSLGYDAVGNPLQITDPLGTATSYAYTQNLPSAATLPLGAEQITTDPLGRVTQRQFSDGTTINRSYDASGVLSSADGLTVQRDAKERATNINGIAIAYDPANRIASLTYAGGKAVNYAYDAAGRLSTVTDWVGGKTTFKYDAAGQISSVALPNGVTSTYTFDMDGRVTAINTGSLASIALKRDAAGKVVSADRNLPLAPTLQSATQQFSYDAAAQLTSATYDAMGRVTAENGRTFTWNLATQLTSFTDGGNATTLTYDGLGEINSLTNAAGTKSFVFNYALSYPALSTVQQNGSDLRYYIYLPNGKLLYSIEAADNSRKFYHFDESGNTQFLTDDTGAVTDSYAITPYGEVAVHMGTTDNPFTWQGQLGVIQEADGLYYMRSRHYDASAARFLSRDPVMSSHPRSAEPYAYARGNPMKYTDPFGTDPSDYGDLSAQFQQLQDQFDNGEISGLDYFVAYLTLAAIANNTDFPPAELQAALDPPPPTETPAPPAPSAGTTAQKTNSVDSASGALGALDAGLGNAVNSVLANLPDPVLTFFDGQLLYGLQPVYKSAKGLVDSLGDVIAAPDQSIMIKDPSGGPPISAILSHDGGTILSHDGGTLLGSDGAGLIAQINAYLLGSDGAGLLGSDGAGLLGSDGAGLLGSYAAGLGGTASGIISSNASKLISSNSGKLLTDNGGAAPAYSGN